MKTIKLFSTAILLFTILTVNAQTSQRGFSFQGYAVSNEGVALAEEAIDVKFTIYPKGGVGYSYEEEHSEVVTDYYGVFHAIVGSKTPILFQKMNFTAKGADFWLRVEVKKTTDAVFTKISDAPMLAVPYARFADNGVPVGTVISFAAGTTKVPEGWLLCDGTEYDGTLPEYTQLYDIIANTWGGTGASDFKVPELRGYFLRGFDNGAGNDPGVAARTNSNGDVVGDVVGSYQTDAAIAHDHTFSGSTSSGGTHSHSFASAMNFSGGSGSSGNNGGDGEGNSVSSTNSAGSHSHSFSGTTANTGDVETRPKNAYVLYIIKY